MNTHLFGIDSIDNPVLIDTWSLMHLYAGGMGYVIAVKYLGLTVKDGFILFNILHIMYEIKDWYFTYVAKCHEDNTKKWVSRSLHNSLADIIFGIVGYILMTGYYDKLIQLGILSDALIISSIVASVVTSVPGRTSHTASCLA